MDLAVLTKEDPQMQENFPLIDEWTERVSFSEGSNSLGNNRLGELTRASRYSTQNRHQRLMFTIRREEHDPGQQLKG